MSEVAKLISSFKKKEVDQIFKTSKKRIKKEGLEIILAPKILDFGRILVITSRKIGGAPKRNKIRRRLKSIYYEGKLFNFGYDCIVIVRQGSAINLEFVELKEILNYVFKL